MPSFWEKVSVNGIEMDVYANVPDGSESPDDAQKYQDWMEEHQKLVNKALLIVAKQRHGSTGNVPLIFQSEYTKFSSPSYRDYSDFGEE